MLLALVEIYEAKRWPIEIDGTFDPIDVLRYAIDELGHSQAELAELLGLALAGVGGSFAPARAHGRDDPQDRRSDGKFRPIFWFVPTRSSEPHERRLGRVFWPAPFVALSRRWRTRIARQVARLKSRPGIGCFEGIEAVRVQ